MRIVQIDGGLGNQMFQFAFLSVLKKKYKNVKPGLHVVRSSRQHQGYELERIFCINTMPSVASTMVSLWVFYFHKLKNKIVKQVNNEVIFPRIRIVKEEAFSVYSDKYVSSKGAILY